jgi:hypothetical protein
MLICLTIASLLLGDRHDIIHTVVDWIPHEVGNRDNDAAEFLRRQHCNAVPLARLQAIPSKNALSHFEENLSAQQGIIARNLNSLPKSSG